jgi:putative ABC transport system substrate-binding protein
MSLLGFCYNCNAGSYLLIESGHGEIYDRFAKSLDTTLAKTNKNHSLIIQDADSFIEKNNETGKAKFDAIICAGIEASIAVSSLHTNTTTIMSMLPKDSFYKLTAAGDITCSEKSCRVIFIDQPVARQFRLIQAALPNTKEITVISSNNSDLIMQEITKTATDFGFHINGIRASDEDDVLTAINQSLASSDLLLAIPDPVIYNRNTARAILLSAFHQRIPIFAYSKSFVRAGAILGIYSTPENIAQYVAELLAQAPKISTTPNTLYPKYFTIDVNLRAADALGITLPEIETLEKRLMAHEK